MGYEDTYPRLVMSLYPSMLALALTWPNRKYTYAATLVACALHSSMSQLMGRGS